jgi:hypothetical protein
MSEVAPALIDGVDATVVLSVLAQVKAGDFTARLPLEWTGVAGKFADGLNDVIIANQTSRRSWLVPARSSGRRAGCRTGWRSGERPIAGRGASTP